MAGVDLELAPLSPGDLRWADLVFLGGMGIHAESARAVIARCNEAGTKVVAGGPLFSSRHEEFPGVDHFVLNEAEITLPLFLEDLRRGAPGRLYTTTDWAEVTTTPVPMWELIDPRQYATKNIQYSRGCPYDCESCDITVLFGHRPRTKSTAQVIAEMGAVYRTGWRGHLFFVHALQKAGLQVQVGFIVGFDSDPPAIFDRLIQFIEESGIVVAMVGLLNAPVHSRLHARLGREKRLLHVFSGDNTDFTMNFLPRMDPGPLMEGYRRVVSTLYAPRAYYRRVRNFLETHRPVGQHQARIGPGQVLALAHSPAPPRCHGGHSCR